MNFMLERCLLHIVGLLLFVQVEIYNERISDLLRPNEMKGEGLEVREHPEFGPTLYRDRDVWQPIRVANPERMFQLLDEGTSNMTKAATLLNKGTRNMYHCVRPRLLFQNDMIADLIKQQVHARTRFFPSSTRTRNTMTRRR
jgi:hypothetical protein